MLPILSATWTMFRLSCLASAQTRSSPALWIAQSTSNSPFWTLIRLARTGKMKSTPQIWPTRITFSTRRIGSAMIWLHRRVSAPWAPLKFTAGSCWRLANLTTSVTCSRHGFRICSATWSPSTLSTKRSKKLKRLTTNARFSTGMAASQHSSSTSIQLNQMMKCKEMILGMTCTPSCQACLLPQHQLQQQTSSLCLTTVRRRTGLKFLLSSQTRKFWEAPVWTPCLKVTATLALAASSPTHSASHQASSTPPSVMPLPTPQSARLTSLASWALAPSFGTNLLTQRRRISTKRRIPWRMCWLQPIRSLSPATIVCQSLVKLPTTTWKPYQISRRWHTTWSIRQVTSTTRYSTCASIRMTTKTYPWWPRLSKLIGGGH